MSTASAAQASSSLGELPVPAFAIERGVSAVAILGDRRHDRSATGAGVFQMRVEIVNVDDRCVGADRAAAAPEHEHTVSDTKLDPGVVGITLCLRDIAGAFELKRIGKPAGGRRRGGRAQGETEPPEFLTDSSFPAAIEMTREPLRGHAQH